MPTILKIGFHCYLMKKASDAANVVKSMADALPVEESYEGSRRLFWPEDKYRSTEISMMTVPESSIRNCKPGEEPLDVQTEPVKLQRLNGTRQLKLLKG